MLENNTQKNKQHGLSGHRIYNTWAHMIDRTSNPNCDRYHDYGGRGITVCDRWHDITNFIEDMYQSFEEGLTLDRIDVNGNYEPANCRWATATTQQRNSRKIYKHNRSGYRGVGFKASHNKWRARIGLGSKVQKFIGYYDTPIDAAMAYDRYVIDNSLEHTLNFKENLLCEK